MAAAFSVYGTYKNNANLRANQALEVTGTGKAGYDHYARTDFGQFDEATLGEIGEGQRLLPGAAEGSPKQLQLTNPVKGILSRGGSLKPGTAGATAALKAAGLDLQGGIGYNKGQTSGDSSYDNYLRIMGEMDAANRLGMTAKEFAESQSVTSTLTDAEAAAAYATNYRMSDSEEEITTKKYTAPSTGKEITVKVKGDAAVSIDKVEKFMRGDVPNPTQELKELNRLKQSNRKLFDSDPKNAERLRELKKLNHNYERSIEMASKLESIGLDNTELNNNMITGLLLDAGNKVTADNRKIKSILAGHGGRLKMVSIWRILPDGIKYLSTIELIPIK